MLCVKVRSRTNLPRGIGISPDIVMERYLKLRSEGMAAGRNCAVNIFCDGQPNLIFKHMKCPERWAQFGMVS